MQGIGGSTAQEQLAELSPWPHQAPAISAAERSERLERVRGLLAEERVEGILVGAGASLSYFGGVGWGASERLVAMLITERERPVMICPTFELGTLEASLAVDADIQLWEEDESPYERTASLLQERRVRNLAVDPELPFVMSERLRRVAPQISLRDGSAIVNGCRMCKSDAEIALMKQAKAMTLEVQRRSALILRKGISATEVRRFIDEAHRALGASGSSFCIVQFGQATAFPHGLPGESYLSEGDVVLIDTGCTVRGYNSDITRTYVFGTPTEKQVQIWEIEKAAQEAAFQAARVGVPCEAIDAAARAVLEQAGLGPGYRLPGLPHRTGHGIGLSIHEAPYLVRGDRRPLRRGMCFSNEPMIVVPGEFGIRLEDHFFLTDTGAEWFTQPQHSISAPFG